MSKRLLLTTGGTREPIDRVRYIGNRSSGRMGVAIAHAAKEADCHVTAITAFAEVLPEADGLVRVETAAQMQEALDEHWPKADLLIMAAAVSDYRAKFHDGKLRRSGPTTLELEPTADLVAACGAAKRDDQRIVGFSLDIDDGNAFERAAAKMRKKDVDLLVFNPLNTLGSDEVRATLLWPDGRLEDAWAGGCRSKAGFADLLIRRALALWS